MFAIRTEALTKHYAVGFWRPKPYVALDALTLQVERGEVFGFLGPNGAGKTTTLKLLMQLIFPTSGTAEILGRPVGDLDMRRRIGYLAENPVYYDNVTGEELLAYFASLFGYRGADRTRRVSRLLDEVGLGAERRFQLRKYSKGMVQRIGIAQALVNDPEVVFLDEPMSGLDPIGRRQVRDIIIRLRDQGTTVFFSSHILTDAEAICSRVGIVAAGRLVASGSLTEIVPFRIRGWELVVGGLSDEAVGDLSAGAATGVTTGVGTGSATGVGNGVATGVTTTRISGDRYYVVLPPGASPDETVARVKALGGSLVSLNPIRDTLEDFFVSQVTGTTRDRPPAEAS